MSDEEIDTPVSEVMTTPVQTVAAETTVAEAARTLAAAGIGSLIVGEDRIEGIVTESDVVESVADARDPAETTVAELMTDPVVTIGPDETVRVAGERMGHNGVKKLPVAEEGRAVGIITTTDLALYLPRYQVGMTAQPEPDMSKGEFE
ncbi:CBS domain-containing protein [Salinirubellus salinus]|uniref:CBS domain-containing protein n=1 Tax=Salinirubellus salinus TaxID=1364945 RepID=A0A9E7R5B5_9EURY|nr:CBS domain-containing protein [Salinirubellus salinus]UWM56084.1 CBS domain-containing protein [Salinirubellus salinus]